jgi:regulatory protein
VSAEPTGGDRPNEDDERRAVLDRAVRALARRDHSAASLRAKLDRAGVSESAREDAVETLERAGYVDDARFARDRAAHLAARGYGDDWIRADLAAQGVNREAAEPALEALEPEGERATRQAAKAGGGVRAVRALARRGFSEGSLERLLATVVADDLPEGVG